MFLYRWISPVATQATDPKHSDQQDPLDRHGPGRGSRQRAATVCAHFADDKYRLRLRPSGPNRKNNWVVSSITSSGHVPFWIEDETGRVSVDPSSATVKAGHRQESYGDGGVTFAGFNSPDVKWVEEMIYDGALVYVLGEAQVKKSGRAPLRQRRAEALRRTKQDTHKLASYDTDRDGKIDESEWQAARDEVDRQLLREDLDDSSQRKRQEDQVVISKPRHRGLPFVIAETASEAKLTGRYAWATGLLFTAASACSGLSVWLLLRNF